MRKPSCSSPSSTCFSPPEPAASVRCCIAAPSRYHLAPMGYLRVATATGTICPFFQPRIAPLLAIAGSVGSRKALSKGRTQGGM
jgi:hypothetical protein